MYGGGVVAKKKVATVSGGFGNVPGFGRVTAPKPASAWAGGRPSSIQIGANAALRPPTFKPASASSSTPSAPSAPAAPKFDMNSLPVDPSYDATVGGLTRTRDDTLAGLTGEKTAALSNFGYNAQFDDKGNVTGLTFDPNNPFSRAALLRKNYQQAKTGTTNSLASRGQLYSGAMTNAQNANDSGFQQNDNALQTSLGQVLSGILGRQRTANTDYETGAGVAYGDRISRAQSSPLYNPAPIDDTPAAAPSSPLSPATLALIEKWRTQGTDYSRNKKKK